jgi:hypothetical protein
MNKSELENLNRDKWNSDKYRLKKFTKAGVASLIGGAFIAFAVGWVFLIPTAAALFLIYGLIVYARERKNRITVSIKPTEAMKAIARREEDIKREKEKLLYEEFQGGIKH